MPAAICRSPQVCSSSRTPATRRGSRRMPCARWRPISRRRWMSGAAGSNTGPRRSTRGHDPDSTTPGERSTMIKFFGLIPRRPDISSEEFHDHYRHPHGTLGRQIPTFRQYVQSHQVHSDRLGEGQETFEAVAEVWFDTVQDAVGLAEDPHYI